ncbi:MAG: hypothetical protein ACT6TC_11735 [Caulobacteraceae bacterium]
MATQAQIRTALDRAAREALGRPLPSTVVVTIRGNRVELVGPPGTGKSRSIAGARKALGGNLRFFSGVVPGELEQE